MSSACPSASTPACACSKPSGKPEPWQEAPKKFWEKPQLAIGLAAARARTDASRSPWWERWLEQEPHRSRSSRSRSPSSLSSRPPTRARSACCRATKAAPNSPAVVIGGGGETQLADLKIDMSRSQYRAFRVTIDRIDQGRVAVLHNLMKDSNGHVRIALNTSALGPRQLPVDDRRHHLERRTRAGSLGH